MKLVSNSGRHTERGIQAYNKSRQKTMYSPSTTKTTPARSNAGKRRKKKNYGKGLIKAAVALVVIIALYCTAVFSDIPFIKKWRTIYIGTAMSTMSHQWLATAFIPQSVIDEVLNVRYTTSEQQYDVTSSWGQLSNEPDEKEQTLTGGSVTITPIESTGSDATVIEGSTATAVDDPGRLSFLRIFDEIDPDTLDEYVAEHPEVIADGWDNFKVNEAGLEQKGTSMMTIQGEQVLAVDAANGILILRVKSDTYKGVLAIVKDPSMLSVYNATSLGEIGQFAHDIAQRQDALLVMGANGFEDEGGVGNGGTLYGLSIASGVSAGEKGSGNFKRAEIRNDNKMYIVSSFYDVNPDTRDAAEFYPAMIVDGQRLIDDSYIVWGAQPRAIIAQNEDMEFMLMVVEGRQGLDNIGITLMDATDILEKYGAYQALNMDGGSTAILCYEGEPITMCSNGYVYGRTLPNAFIVKAKN